MTKITVQQRLRILLFQQVFVSSFFKLIKVLSKHFISHFQISFQDKRRSDIVGVDKHRRVQNNKLIENLFTGQVRLSYKCTNKPPARVRHLKKPIKWFKIVQVRLIIHSDVCHFCVCPMTQYDTFSKVMFKFCNNFRN